MLTKNGIEWRLKMAEKRGLDERVVFDMNVAFVRAKCEAYNQFISRPPYEGTLITAGYSAPSPIIENSESPEPTKPAIKRVVR